MYINNFQRGIFAPDLPDESDGPWKGSNFCLFAFGGPSTRWSAMARSVQSAVYQAKAEALAQCYGWPNSRHCNRLFIASKPQNTWFMSKNMNKTAPNSRYTECSRVDASQKAHIYEKESTISHDELRLVQLVDYISRLPLTILPSEPHNDLKLIHLSFALLHSFLTITDKISTRH